MPSDYETNSNNIITTPGKFEGEHALIPVLWDAVMSGTCDSVYVGDTEYSYVVIESEDKAQFADIAEYGVRLHESEQGFIYSVWFDTEAEFNADKDAMEKEAELYGDEADDE